MSSRVLDVGVMIARPSDPRTLAVGKVVTAILARYIPSSVQMLAEIADRILEYYRPPVTVSVASRITAAPTAPTIKNVMKRLDSLPLKFPYFVLHVSLTVEVCQLLAVRDLSLQCQARKRLTVSDGTTTHMG
nr:unnamed protein product [Spirometra erinaceieuropaei]